MSYSFNIKSLRKQTESGFTLLEILVSLTILSIITIAAVTSLTQFLNSRKHIDANQSKMEALNSALLFLERDLSYAVQRPISAGDNNLAAAMEIYINNPRNRGELLQFTTAYPIPGTASQRTERVSWRFLDNSLYRYSWKFLDHKDSSLQKWDVDSTAIIKQEMLTNVQDINIKVFMGAGNESSRKFLNENVIEGETSIEQLYNLPRLLEFVIARSNKEIYRRLFYIKSRYFELGQDS